MADPGDLSKNPFTALFPSVDVAEQYSAENSRKYGENKQSGTNEPRSEKTGLRGFRPGPTQTGMYSHRRWLEA